MGVIQEYLDLQKKHELQYGKQTVVLMQIGTFYEMYSYDPTYCTTPEAKIDKEGKLWNEPIGHAVELSVILNSVLTHEDGNEPYSIRNPHKVGFPMVALEKNLTTLLANDYVVVRYDQVKKAKDIKGPTERYLAEIISPTMQLDGVALTRPTSNVAVIYIEYQATKLQHHYDNFVITTGAAVIDVITGQNRVCEFYSKAEDQVHAVQELYRFLIAHYPRELVIHINDMPPGLDQHSDAIPNPYVKHLERVLELRRFDRLTVHVNKVSDEYKKIAYQVEFLNRLFTKPQPQQTQGLRLNVIQRRNDRIIEELSLERMNYGRIAYLLLMQHCHSHNPDIIARLAKPDLQWLDEHRHLILTHNAIVQLDLISSKDDKLRKRGEIDSLMAVLDHNQTHLGRRVLQTLLQNPLLDPKEIRTYYDMVDEMLVVPEKQEPLWTILDRQLRELPDVGRLQRKLQIKLLTPKDLAVLYSAYIKIINMYITVSQTRSPVLHTQMLAPDDIANFNVFMARFGSMFNFEALECCYVDTSAESDLRWLEFADCPVKPGYYPDLDQQAQALAATEATLQTIVDHLNDFLVHTRGKKIEFKAAKKKPGAKKQDPTGTVLITTDAKARELSVAQVDTNLCGVLQVLPYTAGERIITSDRITALCTTIDTIRMWMRQRLLNIYESVLEEMVAKYTFYVGIANLVAKLDLIHSYAKAAHLYNYNRPDIIMEPSDTSFIELREARHPIIERIIDGAYVTNDILLGSGGERSQGKLLFGVNQVGKSSLVKLVPLNVIMAQIGCFVPSHMRFVPITRIITRLDGRDNIFAGQSTFAIEMTELRTILRQADARVLVVGDEVAKGTESHSAMAIMGSTVLSLIDAGALFMFATHIHELLDLSAMKALSPDKLQVCHLSISYDEATKTLIYDRKLHPGPGASVYGLMVARSLELPAAFIDQAQNILHEILRTTPQLLDTKHSRYNAELYMHACAMCYRSRAQVELHTHHIIEQNQADEKQMVKKVIRDEDGTFVDIGTMHKNAKDNVIVLCRDCHATLHKQKRELETVTVANGTVIRVRPDQPPRPTLTLALTK